MRIVIGVGGNALLQRGQSLDIETQRANVKIACQSIAKVAKAHEVIITHGNGPQIGLLALQAVAYKEDMVYPLDVLGAESQGMIGYLLSQELKNQLPEKQIVTLLTQVEIDKTDPAFLKPTKLIGPLYNKKEANQLSKKQHWQFAKEKNYFRRVVPSPFPRNILELETIKSLISAETIVICIGGGGIPVVHEKNVYRGIEAVIDKDFATALLAEQIHAERLLLLTDVANVMKNWETVDPSPIKDIHYHELKAFSFASGSMEPKVRAACQFVKNTQKIAHIGLLSAAENILQKEAGTIILP